MNNFKLLYALFRNFEKKDKINFFLLLGLMVISALFEVVSFGAVMPFIGALSNPSSFLKYQMFKDWFNYFQISTNQDIIVFFTICFFTAVIISTVFKLILLKFTTEFTYKISEKFSFSIYKRVLYQPYSYHTAINSGDIITSITVKVSTLTSVLTSVLIVLTNLFISIIISIGLLLFETQLVLFSLISMLTVYFSISLIYKKKLNANSYKISKEQNSLIRTIQEGLGAIRDVILSNNYSFYLKMFRTSNKKLNSSLSSNHFIGHSPKIIMESVLMILIGCLALFSSTRSGGIAAALPILGVLALSAQRLMPAIQVIYQNWSNILASKASIEEVLIILDKPIIESREENIIDPMKFNGKIELKSLSFEYQEAAVKVLKNINLIIPKGVRIGIVGTTGSGKSTLVDIIMGLLPPTSGEILVDGELLNLQNVKNWQQIIANVPQSIYLTDGTIAENIGFGLPKDKINIDLVKRSAQRAGLESFIKDNKEGLNLLVGERGIRLSGGQRQRIGIARALYKGSQVLIFDEATSALDNNTERLILETINGLDRELTVIIIAHRISTLSKCDVIYKIEKGEIEFSGTYQELELSYHK